MVELAQHSIAVLGLLMIVGGVIGFAKAQSKPSLIAGVASGALLFGAYAFTFQNLQAGLIAAFVISTLLDGVFAVRLSKTKKFMPSGMMLVVNVLAQLVFIFGIVSMIKTT